MIWLDADTPIREQTGGVKSLDDFARVFFGGEDGGSVPVTYEFDDAVKSLNTIVPHDWSGFLKTRVEGLGKSSLEHIRSRPGVSLDPVHFCNVAAILFVPGCDA